MRMAAALFVAFVLLTVVSIGILTYVVWGNRRRIRRTSAYTAKLEQDLSGTRGELAETRHELSAYMRAMGEIIGTRDGTNNVAETVPAQPKPKRERWLKSVPPLAGLVDLLTWLRKRPGGVIPAASLAAAAGILGLILVGTLPEAPEGTHEHERPPVALPLPGGPSSPASSLPTSTSTPPLPLPSSTLLTTTGSTPTSAAGAITAESILNTSASGVRIGSGSATPTSPATTTTGTTTAVPTSATNGRSCSLNVAVDDVLDLCILRGR